MVRQYEGLFSDAQSISCCEQRFGRGGRGRGQRRSWQGQRLRRRSACGSHSPHLHRSQRMSFTQMQYLTLRGLCIKKKQRVTKRVSRDASFLKIFVPHCKKLDFMKQKTEGRIWSSNHNVFTSNIFLGYSMKQQKFPGRQVVCPMSAIKALIKVFIKR